MCFGKSWHHLPRLVPSAVRPLWHQLLPAMKKPPQVRTFSFSLFNYLLKFSSQCTFSSNILHFCEKKSAIFFFPGTSAPCYNDVEMLTEFSWNDCNIRRIFIRKVGALTLVTMLTPQVLWISNE